MTDSAINVIIVQNLYDNIKDIASLIIQLLGIIIAGYFSYKIYHLDKEQKKTIRKNFSRSKFITKRNRFYSKSINPKPAKITARRTQTNPLR